MRNIKQVSPNIGLLEKKYVRECLDAKWLTEGPFAEKFKAELKTLTGAKHVFLISNGTLALYVSLLALDLPKGSEILVPAFTFMATGSAVVFCGFKPVYYDVDLRDWHGTISSAQSLITENTKAVIPVHIYGSMCDMPRLIDFATANNLYVIEDAAQAVGVRYSGKHAGTFGNIGVFSFFADKTITMGEGAAIITNDDEIADRVRLIRNQGRPNSGTFIHPSLGMNFRVTDLQCAIGLAQIERLGEISAIRSNNYKKYHDSLKDVLSYIELQNVNAEIHFSPFRFSFTSKFKEKIDSALRLSGVETRSFFYPLNRQPCMNGISSGGDCLNAFELYTTGSALPVHMDLTYSDIEYVAEVIKTALMNPK